MPIKKEDEPNPKPQPDVKPPEPKPTCPDCGIELAGEPTTCAKCGFDIERFNKHFFRMFKAAFKLTSDAEKAQQAAEDEKNKKKVDSNDWDWLHKL